MKKAKRQIFRGKCYAGVITDGMVFPSKLIEPEFDRLAYSIYFCQRDMERSIIRFISRS
ncbi:hypothetical protein JGH11_18245 [Dysgonomonas sp. Marseille-P4677]|uniref:hypothetical protein n=1 Tax=Dysgonomonas sp. Marseille-P4677 TaxID=2364790 RepID=UPI001912C499|nr:hypothetical protein [Dysgonomonas sp. Marseille-P4677]MBK5722816.1 hypothetical protein [Dysgonomonas sp. Marseille-P4677]